MRISWDKIGRGDRALVFIHGVWMSRSYFHRQRELNLSLNDYTLYFIDLPSHGHSRTYPDGNTVGSYARDLEEFFRTEGLTRVLPVAWSMGALVLWEYVKQFGSDRLMGTVNISQPPTDFKYDDYSHAFFDLAALRQIMHAVQTDRDGFLTSFLPSMFKKAPAAADLKWMHEECCRVHPAVASAILFDQATVDYRESLERMTKPNLLCWGRDEGLISLEAGYHLRDHQPHSRLVVFEESGHCPFLEEAEAFNQVLADFAESL